MSTAHERLREKLLAWAKDHPDRKDPITTLCVAGAFLCDEVNRIDAERRELAEQMSWHLGGKVKP